MSPDERVANECLAKYVTTLREIRAMGFDVQAVIEVALGPLQKPIGTAEERAALIHLYREALPEDLRTA